MSAPKNACSGHGIGRVHRHAGAPRAGSWRGSNQADPREPGDSDTSNIPMTYTQVPARGWEGDSTSGKSCAPAPMNIKRQGRTMINIKGSRKPSHQLIDVKCCAFTR
ncbi:hypothetical protein P608_15425 [Comamonas thiooxydans]|uniref:Uncharacterized protein n=2 Tax=Comamonas thiooxydans TaxID=363952 RepID=A0A0E3BVV4_9BURK|nr:hypothetical protein P608_15425 [Comamonas thiooxydans]KGH14503.1 hypothetical protein P607_22775 [Comamonas thiooxydans]KGH22348.1 hypothetical protein P606_16400 [Comamonas thiooxydans]